MSFQGDCIFDILDILDMGPGLAAVGSGSGRLQFAQFAPFAPLGR